MFSAASLKQELLSLGVSEGVPPAYSSIRTSFFSAVGDILGPLSDLSEVNTSLHTNPFETANRKLLSLGLGRLKDILELSAPLS